MTSLLRALRPVDRILILFNAGFAILWLFGLGRYSNALLLSASHIAAIGVSLLSAALGPKPSILGRGLRDLYPIVLIALYWLEIGMVRDVFHATTNDALIARIDLLLGGGVHIQEHWMPAMPWVWFSELMFAVYWVYYPMVFLTPLVLFFAKRRETVAVVFYTTVAYLVCYTSYAIFPVDGPSHTMERMAGPHTEGFFYQLVMTGTHSADSMGTAFPSSHVVGAVVMALLAWKFFSRPWGVLFMLGALGVVVSTVYTQGHFAIDSVVGVAYAAVIFYWLGPWLDKVLPRLRPAAQPVGNS
ncbi:MAG: phosphatase PAP2 family protein [Gemmatimonadales bacterium]|jgi:membrane-associated phospholipid phosphatase